MLDPTSPLIDEAGASHSEGQRSYVLLADDNADMREYARRLLNPQYEVKVVADGKAALQAMHERRPDLLLSDVMMPRLDGFGLLTATRADPALRDLPVILLSARAGDEARVEGLDAGADDYLVKPFAARELLARVRSNLDLARMRRAAAEQIREEARRLELLNHAGSAIAAELDLERVVQIVTDAAVELTGAEFGAFFYNVPNDAGESYTLYTLSGESREACAGFPMPRNTNVFDPTFRGEGIVRSDDITRDPRYGQNPPYFGKTQGPVRSYLALPVVSRSGEVIGGLFFGHSAPGIFSERDELIAGGIAAQAAIAIDNARLYRASRQAAGKPSCVERRSGAACRGRNRGAHAHRGGVAAGAEDGGGRSAYRRRRARFQQPADGDLRRCRHLAAAAAIGTGIEPGSHPPCCAYDRRGWTTSGHSDAAPAGIRTPAGARCPSARCQQAGCWNVGAAAAHTG